MSDQTTNASPETGGMPATVSSKSEGGTASNSIPAEHIHYRDRVLAMDPIRDVSGVVVDNGQSKGVSPTVDTLAPEDRAPVLERLSALPPELRDGQEAKLVSEVLRAKLPQIRSSTGLGEDALPFHREQALIARDYQDAHREWKQYAEMIDKVVDVRLVANEQTGEPESEPIYQVQGAKRQAYDDHMRDLERRMRLLQQDDGRVGIEAKNRLDAAMSETVAMLAKRDEEAYVAKEVQSRTKAKLLEERIEKQANALANIKRNEAR